MEKLNFCLSTFPSTWLNNILVLFLSCLPLLSKVINSFFHRVPAKAPCSFRLVFFHTSSFFGTKGQPAPAGNAENKRLCPQAQGFYAIFFLQLLLQLSLSLQFEIGRDILKIFVLKLSKERVMFLAAQKTNFIFFSSPLPPFSHTSSKILHISPLYFDLEIEHLPIFNSYYRRIQLSLNLYIAIHWSHICCTSTVNLG